MPGAPNQVDARSRRGIEGQVGLWAVLLLFCASVVAVNPVRECPQIDDWAYAKTSWRLLETGEYRLHEWLAANFPFQAIWGAMFCLVFGKSFAALRLSTVALSLVGLVAFRSLAVEHGLCRSAANLLTLCVASSSMFFHLSLTFMTEVPFFSLMTVAMLFYTRAVRLTSVFAWVLATIAGASAILVRQFGAALIPALVVVWFLDPRRTSRLAYYALGLALPALATAWQLNRGWQHPNWAAEFHAHRQARFLFSESFFTQLPWRPTVVFEYLALWLVPLVFLAAWVVFRELSAYRLRRKLATEGKRNPLPSLVASIVFFAAAVAYGWKVGGTDSLMPFAAGSYKFLANSPDPLRHGITLIVVAGAALFARISVARYVRSTRAALGPAELVLDLTTLFSLAFILSFNQFVDRYFLVCLPYAAIVVGRPLAEALLAWRRTVIVCCVVLSIGSAVWTREDLARDEAVWTLSERLRTEGILPEQIFSDEKWLFFWQFEDSVHKGQITSTSDYADLLALRGGWLGRSRASAEYRIVDDLRPPFGEIWRVVDQTRYFSVYARGYQTLYAVRRVRPIAEPASGSERSQ
jgi:Dolichyl-phosphate-mannose-protein mannosyltransferase